MFMRKNKETDLPVIELPYDGLTFQVLIMKSNNMLQLVNKWAVREGSAQRWVSPSEFCQNSQMAGLSTDLDLDSLRGSWLCLCVLR